jgi:predicted amidohydrolase
MAENKPPESNESDRSSGISRPPRLRPSGGRRQSLIILSGLLLAHISSAVEPAAQTVRVATIQFPPVMGRTEENLRTITDLVTQAAAQGAKIVVTPECAAQGYMDPISLTGWSKQEPGARDVRKVAEPVPGPTTSQLSQLAQKLGIYLCVGMVESATNDFFNSQVLLSPTGAIVAHHRKKALWTPGDSSWCSPGDLPVQVVDTPLGRIGLMICFDFHVLPKHLAKQKADIILYSVGWYGPNEKEWFQHQFPQKAVIPFGFSVVAANWTGSTDQDEWPGRGHSCIITGDGKVAAMATTVVGNEIVIADIPVALKKQIPARP